MNRLTSPRWLVVTLGLGLTSSALAQPAQEDPDKSNQAGPTQTNTNGTGVSREGNINDPSGTDQSNQSDSTAPVNPQITTEPAPPPPSTTVVVPAQAQAEADTVYERGSRDHERIGMAIALGGGTSGFTNEQLRGATNLGGEWDVRVTLGTRSPVAFEASYIGSAQRIKALGLDNDAMLVGNGVQGAVRLNGTIDAPIQPFIYGGAAWRRYDLTNAATNTSDVSGKDDVLELPMGLGVAGRFRGLMLDARGEFRYVTNSDLVPTQSGPTDTFGEGFSGTSAAAMHRWGVNANVGYEF